MSIFSSSYTYYICIYIYIYIYIPGIFLAEVFHQQLYQSAPNDDVTVIRVKAHIV